MIHFKMIIHVAAGGRITEGPFNIDPKSGIITLVGSLNKAQVAYRLNITAVDNGGCCGGTTSRRNSGIVVIEIKDINNNAPRFLDCATYNPIVMEKENVGTFVIQVRRIVKLHLYCLQLPLFALLLFASL